MNRRNTRADYQRIPAMVSELRAQARMRFVHAGLVWSVAASALGLLGSVGLFIFASPEAWLRLLVAGLWLGSVAGLLWWAMLRPLGQVRELGQISQLIEAHNPELRNDVTASLQFVDELDELERDERVSVALVEGLLDKTLEAMGNLRRKLPDALPRPALGWPYGLSAAAMASFILLGLVAPDAMRAGVRGLLFGPPAAVAEAGARQEPIVGDLEINYRYPDYTGMGERTILNSTGDIEVLRGTMVTLSGVALRKVNRAELVITPEEGATVKGPEGEPVAAEPSRVLLQRQTGGRLVGAFPALTSGTYTIEAELADGTAIFDGITRLMRVIPDEDPRIAILDPKGEVDVAPQDVVTFNYEASDDFGLTELAVVTTFGGDEKTRKRTVIKTFGAEREILPGDARPTEEDGTPQALTLKGEHLLDLAPYELRPKDRLMVQIEAVDNDTTDGPKVIASAPVVLRVASPEDKHLEIIQSQEEIFEALLSVLGDYLETPVGARYTDPRGVQVEGIPPTWTSSELGERHKAAQPPHAKAAEVLVKMKGVADRMAQDPLMLKRDYDLFVRTHGELSERHQAEAGYFEASATSAERQTLNTAQLTRLFTLRQESVRATERAIITLEDLVASQRMENALETAKDLKEAMERLKELLKKYNETQDEALKAEIMREIMRLRQQMQEMMAKMKSQIQNLPKEHVNMEAMDREGMMNKASDAANNLDEIMKALEQGDMERAMQMLDQMSQSVDDMMAQMQEEFDEMQPEGLSELDKRVSEVMDELNNLEAQEQDLAKKTEELNRQMEAEQRERMQERLDEFAQEQLEKVRQMRERLEKSNPSELDPMDQSAMKRVEQSAERLERALQQKDMAEALEQARELAREMENAETSFDFRGKYLKRGDPRREGYDKARQGMRQNRPTAEEVARDLEQLMEDARPRPNGQQAQQLREMSQRQQEVRERTEKLRQELQGDGSFPMLGEELGPGLQQAEQFMEGAEQSLRGGEGGRAQESERLASEKLKGLKESLKKTLKEQRMGQQQQGGRELSKEKVEIPEKDLKAPREFREDIMEAMKEGGIESYESELQEYYESLVR